jgi:hypothetical protein
MSESDSPAPTSVPLDDIQRSWRELNLRVEQLETEREALKKEAKALRFLVETVIEHRQKSHGELILLLTGLVSKLPLNDVGVIVSRLVEHRANTGQFLAGLIKGATDAPLPQPEILKSLDQTKRDLQAAVKTGVEELVRLDTPIEKELLESLVTDPEKFYAPRSVRANRCFIKGQLPKERVLREFGEEALPFFNDLTTDPKLNPRPKPEEIVLGFRPEFDALFQQQNGLPPDKRSNLQSLYQKVQRSRAASDEARAMRNAFQRMSFALDLLHYYDHQNTEAPDVVFAQRMPALVEQLALGGPQEILDQKLIAQAEVLLSFIINADHRLMVINNIGKGGGLARTLKFILRLRADHNPGARTDEVILDLVKHLVPIPPQKPSQAAITAVLQLMPPGAQRQVVIAIMGTDRLRRDEAEALGKAIGASLGLQGLDQVRSIAPLPPEVQRQRAWEQIKEIILDRGDPSAIASAIRDRLHAQYDADEIRQSWITLIEADAMSIIRVICQLPYLADGRTDGIARTVMEIYASRLTHEKYSGVYTKVLNSLKNMFRAKPDSPTLLNFLAIIRWANPEAAAKMYADIGMPAPA